MSCNLHQSGIDPDIWFWVVCIGIAALLGGGAVGWIKSLFRGRSS
jgi:hypothetical protein